jgi:hypothetical protein
MFRTAPCRKYANVRPGLRFMPCVKSIEASLSRDAGQGVLLHPGVDQGSTRPAKMTRDMSRPILSFSLGLRLFSDCCAILWA